MNERVMVDPSMQLLGTADHRVAVQRAAEERAFERRRALDSQADADATPQDRIRTWERLHALGLPLVATHPLLAVIATQTRLTLTDVRDEQKRRRLLDPSPSPQGS